MTYKPSINTLFIGFILSLAINLRFSIPGFSQLSHVITGMLLVPLATYVLIACCMASSAYVQREFPSQER